MADLRITHVSVLTEDGTILRDQTVDVTDGRFSKIAPASESSLKVKEPGKAAPQAVSYTHLMSAVLWTAFVKWWHLALKSWQ